jgi:hypothetical protein
VSATALREGAEQIASQAARHSHDTLAAALVHALADLTVVEKGRTVTVRTKDGNSYSYTYAELSDVVKVTRRHLAEHGLVALTPVHEHANGLACTVIIVHEGGETMDLGPFPFPHGRDAQATGSMVTYHRRYALVAALGIAAGDDDDGATAAPAAPAPPAWNTATAKAHLVTLAEGDTALAKQAWDEIDGEGKTADELTAAFEAWVNQPADPASGSPEGDPDG